MFSYGFMQIALVAVILLGIMLPMIGLNMTTKRLSMIGDTLSHTALCGVALGLAAGSLPIPWAIGTSIVAGVIIEIVRNRFSKYSELTLAIVMSIGIGIASILTSVIKGNSIEKYLFGSILTISMTDLWILVGLFVFVVLFNIIFFRSNMYVAYSVNEAKISGLPVRTLNMVNTIIVAMAIAVSSTIIGELLVASLLVLPVATSLQLFKSYKTILLTSIVTCVITSFLGLVFSYLLNVNVGGLIVVMNAAVLVLALIGKGIYKFIVFYQHKAKIKEEEEEKNDHA